MPNAQGPTASERFFDQPRPLVFGHRGAAGLAPENTLPAFARGIAEGVDGIELDVHLSADGVPVVIHDATLDRTTDAVGAVTARTAAELARVDAGYRFHPEEKFPFRRQGIGVPTLRDVLANHPDTRVIIEMKMDVPQLGEAVAAEVRRASAVDRVCIAGYGSRSAAAARAVLPDMACSACQDEVKLALYRTWAFWPVRDVRYGGYQVPERVGRLRVASPRFVRYAHLAGLRVHIWTVDEEAVAERLLSFGVDGLITNRPDVIVRARDRFLGITDIQLETRP
jgi:glycerophosphoryl diester phosphodiesterase